jgi:hypothetical protein
MENRSIGLITNTGSIPFFTNTQLAYASPADIIHVTGGNTGNVCFIQAIEKLLNYNVKQIDWSDEPSTVRKSIGHIVICAANQLGVHADLGYWAERLNAFQLPVTVVSIGAQTESRREYPILQQGSIDFLNTLQKYKPSRGANISVRGEYTQRLLKNYGIESIVVGCPSLFYSEDPQLASSFRSAKANHLKPRISVAAGNPFDARSKSLEAKLVSLLSLYPGNYILQHPREFIDFCSGNHSNLTDGEIDLMLEFIGHKAFGSQELIDEFLRDRTTFFIDVGHWMQSIRRSDLVVGTRYHGIAIGIQAGVPGCVYTIDSRTEELCETTGIKYISAEAASSMDAADLIESSRWSDQDIALFQENRRQKSIIFSAFLESNNLPVPEYLHCLQ